MQQLKQVKCFAAPQRCLAAIDEGLTSQKLALSHLTDQIQGAESVNRQLLVAVAAVCEKLTSLADCVEESNALSLKQLQLQERAHTKLDGIISCLSHKLVHSRDPSHTQAEACLKTSKRVSPEAWNNASQGQHKAAH